MHTHAGPATCQNGSGPGRADSHISREVWLSTRRQDFRQSSEKRVSYSLVTVTELTATGVVMMAQGKKLSSVCDFTTCFWIEVSHMFLHMRDLENMVMRYLPFLFLCVPAIPRASASELSRKYTLDSYSVL
jgi:hypothetical protein